MADEMPMTRAALVEVRVDDIRLSARIGAFPHEEGRRQLLKVSATLIVQQPRADSLDQAVDYARIVEHAEALAERHVALIETFGLRLAEACTSEAGVVSADIRVEKPGALSNGVASARIVLAAASDRAGPDR